MFWAVFGRGSIANADVDVFDGYGDTDPTLAQIAPNIFPNLDATFLWHCTDTTHEPLALVGETFVVANADV